MILKNKIILFSLVGGCAGVLVAFCLILLKTTDVSVLLILWPTSIAGMANPTTLPDKLLIGAVELGGNFLLYGAIGAVAGVIVDSISNSTKPK